MYNYLHNTQLLVAICGNTVSKQFIFMMKFNYAVSVDYAIKSTLLTSKNNCSSLQTFYLPRFNVCFLNLLYTSFCCILLSRTIHHLNAS